MRDYLVLKRSLLLMHRKDCESQVPAASCCGMNRRLVRAFGRYKESTPLEVLRSIFVVVIGLNCEFELMKLMSPGLRIAGARKNCPHLPSNRETCPLSLNNLEKWDEQFQSHLKTFCCVFREGFYACSSVWKYIKIRNIKEMNVIKKETVIELKKKKLSCRVGQICLAWDAAYATSSLLTACSHSKALADPQCIT